MARSRESLSVSTRPSGTSILLDHLAPRFMSMSGDTGLTLLAEVCKQGRASRVASGSSDIFLAAPTRVRPGPPKLHFSKFRMAASSAFPLTPCCRSFVGIRDGTAPPTATFLALDPESQFWLHAATALCHMLLGIMTILIVIRLRYQANPNTGIFAVAAKLGIGSVTEARSDTTDPTVYISYPQTFDLVWILNILVVIIVALSLLGCGLERTHEGPRVTWFALVNVANVFWFYRALLAVSWDVLHSVSRLCF